MSMSCDRADAFKAWMSTVCLCHVTVLIRAWMSTVLMSCDRVDAFRAWMSTVCLCHVTVLMPSGRGCRQRVAAA